MVHPRFFPAPSRANPGTPTATDGRHPTGRVIASRPALPG
jgi:hypothetical protein